MKEDKAFKLIAGGIFGWGCLSAIGSLALTGVIIYVVAHFVTKLW